MHALELILIGLVLGLAAYLISLLKQLREIKKQLDFLEHRESRMRIHSPLRQKDLQNLVRTLNRFIDEDHKRKIQLLEQKQRSQEVLVGLSHDIRTPLTSLSGYLQLLAKTDEPDKKTYYLKIMEERLTSLSHNLEDLFTYAKLNQEDYPLTLEPLDFKEFFLHELFAYYEDFKMQGLEPQLDLPEEPLAITADPNALARVIQNILKNVLHHGAGDLRVRMGQQSKAGPLYNYLELSNGLAEGSRPDAKQLFEKFYKADQARTENSTGLGLSIAQSLVDLMGGEIQGHVEGDKLFTIQISFPAC